MTKEKRLTKILLAVTVAMAALVFGLLLWLASVWKQGVQAVQPPALPGPEMLFDAQLEQMQPVQYYIPPNPYKAEDFARVGEYLQCVTDRSIVGIDVSKYQGWIDWEQVKAAGVEFVMIRVGGRGYGAAGNMFADDYAYQNYLGAKAAGLKVGAYFFSQAVSVDEAVEEAVMALSLTEGWSLDLPIAYDWEYISETARTANVDTRMLTDYARAFCETVTSGGKEAMIYVCPWFGVPYLDEITQYPQWLARYTDQMDYKRRFDMWQYSCTGKVPGITGDVDLNLLIPYDDTFD